MKKYEAVFILDIRKVEDDGSAFSNELKKIIESELKGKVMDSFAMGRKQFVREIKRRKAGIYWNYVFEIPPDTVSQIRNRFHLDERVLRLLVINYERPDK